MNVFENSKVNESALK